MFDVKPLPPYSYLPGSTDSRALCESIWLATDQNLARKQASDLREADVICCILRPNFIVQHNVWEIKRLLVKREQGFVCA